MGGIIFLIWIVGWAISAIGYYCIYRDLGPTVGRIIATLLWPIAIPIDFVFYDRCWPQRLIANWQRRTQVIPETDWVGNPPELGSWRSNDHAASER